MIPISVTRGDSPLILAMPHGGTYLPDDVLARLNARGRALADTDWHIDRLYDGLLPDVTVVRATFHRYLIDANRDPAGSALYPGQNGTGLVPLTDFDGAPIWNEGAAPTAAEIKARIHAFHDIYHRILRGEIARIRAYRGRVILYDCHSIRSRIPFLFDGRLPDFNLGSNDGASCAEAVVAAAMAEIGAARGYTAIRDGRFKGGWTTRHYGRPRENVHAVQMELAQGAYLATEAPPFAYDAEKAEPVRAILRRILSRLDSLALEGGHDHRSSS